MILNLLTPLCLYFMVNQKYTEQEFLYVAMGSQASTTTAEMYMQAFQRTAITTALQPPKVWE